MIEYCVKIPIFRIKNEHDFITNGYQSLYNESYLTNKNEHNWFLIDYLVNCKKTETGYKNLNGNNLVEDEMIYLYGNKLHTEKSIHQKDNDIFVINRIIDFPPSNQNAKKEYKILLVKLLNILRFARYDYMVFPKSALKNISSFKSFMKEYFKISI